jgi:hypothetical protein
VIYVTAYAEIPSEISAQTDSVKLVPLTYIGGKRHYNVVIGHKLHAIDQTLASAVD